MQFLSRLSAQGWASDRARSFALEASAGSRLPYAGHVAEHVVALRDGGLMLTLAIEGFAFETADTGEINYRKALRETMLRAAGSPRHALWHHIIRRQVRANLSGMFADPFSTRLDAMWRARIAARRLYANHLFLTIVRRPPAGGQGWRDWGGRLGLKRRRGAAEADGALIAAIRAIEAVGEQLLAALSAYGARMLGTYRLGGALASEPLEFLSALYNAELRPVRLPEGDAGDYLPYRRVSFGHNAFELGSTAEAPRQFGGILAIKDYPAQTAPGMFDDLLRIPCAMVVSQSFAFTTRGQALSRMNLALRRMRASEDEAVSLRDELAEAKDDVAAGRASFGAHHMSVAVRGASEAEVDHALAEAQAALTDLGLISVREDIALEPAFWAQFPGNFGFIARPALVSTANLASFASLHNHAHGQASGNLWGDAVTVFETSAAGPYHFNFHKGDLGNFTVIGPSGSGKTVIVTFLLAQARRFAPRIVMFDKDRGAELFIRAIGGRYAVLRPGEPSGINPLALADTPANRHFLAAWIAVLAGSGTGGVGTHNGGLTPSETQIVAQAIDANFAAPARHRRLASFVDLLRGHERPHDADLYARLRPWWGAGPHAWLFDNAEDHIDLTQPTLGFDMTRLLDDPVLRTPAMMVLFHRIDERLDGTPAIVVVDEGWKALDDAIFVERLRDWEKTLRKRGALVGFVTQNAEDALASRIATAIVEQTATQIFTANPRARAQDYCGGFGLTRHELALVRAMPDNAHNFLVKQGRESAVLRLNLAGEHEILTILSGREASVRAVDAIRAEVGDDPAAWMPALFAQMRRDSEQRGEPG